MDDLSEQMENRHYKSSVLPTFSTTQENPNELEISKAIYSEVNSNYRHLASVRFKLLGFVPAVTIIAWVQLITNIPITSLSMALVGVVIGLIGLRVTYGIKIYDQRNDDLYDDLISRGRKIEEEWGIHTGIFRGRLTGFKEDFLKKKINHGRGLSLIYTSVYYGWGLIILWYGGSLTYWLVRSFL